MRRRDGSQTPTAPTRPTADQHGHSRRGSHRVEAAEAAGVEAAEPPKPKRSMKSAAGPSPPVSSPSSTSTSKVSRSPSSFARLQHHDGVPDFRSVLAEHRDRWRSADPWQSFRRLRWLGDHSSSKWVVSECPAARTGRSANTIEFGATPVSVSFPPCRLAPRAFITINDGTISGPAWPIVFCSGTCSGAGGVVWASDGAAPQSRSAMIMQPVRFFVVMSNSLLSCPTDGLGCRSLKGIAREAHSSLHLSCADAPRGRPLGRGSSSQAG